MRERECVYVCGDLIQECQARLLTVFLGKRAIYLRKGTLYLHERALYLRKRGLHAHTRELNLH